MSAPEDAWRALELTCASLTEQPDESEPREPSDDWSLTPRALQFMTLLVEHVRPCKVLEFGSGTSTIALGRACANLAVPAHHCAIENDPHHVRTTRRHIAKERLGGSAAVLYAPLVSRRRHGRMVPVYQLDERVRTSPPVDLVLVDGPPLPLGGREGALFQALQAARVGAIVLLDDSRRASEMRALDRVHECCGESVEIANLLGFAKGLAAIVVTGHIGSVGHEEARPDAD